MRPMNTLLPPTALALRGTISNRTGALLSLTAAAFAVLSAACQQPIRPTDPTVADLPPSRTPDEIWDHTLSVLRLHGFEPDVQDRANGRISTAPETTRQWYEPWRRDAVEPYDIMVSSFHTMQRQVTVQFRLEGNEWKADVTVDVYQLSEREPQITTASSVLHGYTGALPDTTGHRTEERRWRHVGRDGAMESRLLREIVA